MNTIKQTQTVNLVPYKKSLSIIEKNATALSIKTEAEIKSASDILFQIGDVQKKVKAEKDRIVKPAKEIIAWAKEKFGPIENECLKAETIIKIKIIDYDSKKQKEAIKKLAQISDKVSFGKMSLEKASEKVENLTPLNSYSGENGSIQFRQQKVIVITDETQIPRKYLEPNMSAIRTAALAGEAIPGVEVRIEKIVAKGRI